MDIYCIVWKFIAIYYIYLYVLLIYFVDCLFCNAIEFSVSHLCSVIANSQRKNPVYLIKCI